MRTAVLGAYTYAEFGLLAVAFLPLVGGAAFLHRDDPTKRIPGRWMRRFGRATSRLTPLWRFSVEGQRPADIDTRGYVVVCNHESAADPFLLSYLPFDMRWIAKEELYKVPVIGQLMSLSGDIPLRRGDGDSVRDMMTEARRTLEGGMSVMIFPEGTRSKDGRLLPFKDGAFRLALEAGAPILPLALAGTHNCRPKGSSWFGDADAVVKVLSPIETTGLQLSDLPSLRERTRTTIAQEVTGLRRRLGYADPNAEPLAPVETSGVPPSV